MKEYNLLMNWKSQYIKKSMFYKMIKRSQCNLRKIPEGNYSGNVHVDFKKNQNMKAVIQIIQRRTKLGVLNYDLA